MDPGFKLKIQRDVALLALSIAIAAVLVLGGIAEGLAETLGGWGVFGALLAGIGFSSAFFAVPATVILFTLAQDHLPFWLVAIAGGLGAMAGDWLIFRFLREGIAEDFRFIIERGGMERLRALFQSRLFYWFGSFIAALIIASPLPDEVGLALFGILRFDVKRFLPISFALNFLGILVVTLLAQL